MANKNEKTCEAIETYLTNSFLQEHRPAKARILMGDIIALCQPNTFSGILSSIENKVMPPRYLAINAAKLSNLLSQSLIKVKGIVKNDGVKNDGVKNENEKIDLELKIYERVLKITKNIFDAIALSHNISSNIPAFSDSCVILHHSMRSSLKMEPLLWSSIQQSFRVVADQLAKCKRKTSKEDYQKTTEKMIQSGICLFVSTLGRWKYYDKKNEEPYFNQEDMITMQSIFDGTRDHISFLGDEKSSPHPLSSTTIDCKALSALNLYYKLGYPIENTANNILAWTESKEFYKDDLDKAVIIASLKFIYQLACVVDKNKKDKHNPFKERFTNIATNNSNRFTQRAALEIHSAKNTLQGLVLN